MAGPQDPFAPPPDDDGRERPANPGPGWYQPSGGWQGGAEQAPAQQPGGFGQDLPGHGQPFGGYGAQAGGYGAPYGAVRPQGTNGLAIASLVCAFLCTPLGLVFGFMAKSQIRRTGQAGNGLATAGIVVSVVSLVLGVVVALGPLLSTPG